MSSQLKLRRGSTVSHAGFTGADGEVTFDTDKNCLVTHDGTTAGGHPHVKASDLVAPLIEYMPAGTGAVATTLQAKLRERVSILDFIDDAALGLLAADPVAHRLANTVDWSSAIQAAVDFCQTPTPIVDLWDLKKPCSIFFPAGLYPCYSTIRITGGVSFEGDGGPASISGSTIKLQSGEISPGVFESSVPLFSVDANVSCAVYFDRLRLAGNGAPATIGDGLFCTTGTGSLGNSYYFRDCWFSTPNYYAISINTPTDDVQITGCTFDVALYGFIALGKGAYNVVNSTISGNTFYMREGAGAYAASAVNLINVSKLLIANNRFYTGSGTLVDYAITCNPIDIANIKNVNISGNVCDGIKYFLNIAGSDFCVTGNIVKNALSPIAISGSGIRDKLLISNNILSGVSGAFGLIDATGVGITNSIFKNNIIEGVGSSAYAMNFEPQTYVTGSNIISDNIQIGCTNDGSTQTINFVPFLYSLGGTAGVYTYSVQNGKATVVGTNLLAVQIEVTVASVTTPGVGEVVIMGIPFTAVERTVGALAHENIIIPAGGYAQTSAIVPASQNYVRTFYSGSNVGFNVLQSNYVLAGSTIYCNFLMRI